jgi:hypothetical protein
MKSVAEKSLGPRNPEDATSLAVISHGKEPKSAFSRRLTCRSRSNLRGFFDSDMSIRIHRSIRPSCTEATLELIVFQKLENSCKGSSRRFLPHSFSSSSYTAGLVPKPCGYAVLLLRKPCLAAG